MARDLTPGWYILLYHDVSWEENAFIRHIGGSCPPDVFRDHVKTCEEFGQLVSIGEGMQKLQARDIRGPLFSFWFDDGFVGVRRYAAPILAERGITGATSICSRFATRKEMFWRLKLSYLHSIDGGHHLRSRLRKHGYSNSELVRHFTMDRFGSDVLAVIEELYNEAAGLLVQDDAFRIFDTPEGLLNLHKMGWVIANHSAAHYPIGEKHVEHLLSEQFEECEKFIEGVIGQGSDYWVFPFSRHIGQSAIDIIHNRRPEVKTVLVGNRVNLPAHASADRGILNRIQAPASNRKKLAPVLFAATQ